MGVSALGDLIDAQRAATGRSYEAVAKRATEAGYPISKSWVYDLATKPIVDMPATDKLYALAHGLTLPLPVVVDAALESCGLRRTSAPGGRWVTITARKEDLTEQKQRALEQQVEALFSLYEDIPDE